MTAMSSKISPILEMPPQSQSQGECLEILSVDLLSQHRPLVEELKSFTRTLGLELGWHYLLDLSWILSRLGAFHSQVILDAGAGTGVMQWYLARGGATVISVDRTSRVNLPLRFRRRFRVQGLRPADLAPDMETFQAGFNRDIDGTAHRPWPNRLYSQSRDLAGFFFNSPEAGSVKIYNQDLSKLDELRSDSVDSVVAVSSLEHNSPEGLSLVVAELLRVLKPGGRLLATLVAGRDADTWHEPSQAWCYHETSLRKIFNLPADTPSNFSQYDRLFSELRECAELRDNLARFYFKSGSTGMPWGKWDPQYLPVGVCKVKTLPV
jgi:SAM-dependent methyltransferase